MLTSEVLLNSNDQVLQILLLLSSDATISLFLRDIAIMCLLVLFFLKYVLNDIPHSNVEVYSYFTGSSFVSHPLSDTPASSLCRFP